jgi:YgiT-type zinc finger domain-containing protein
MIEKIKNAIKQGKFNITDKCHLCGTEPTIGEVENLLKSNNDVATIKVNAGVCHKCGEIVFDAETVMNFFIGRQYRDPGPLRSLRCLA